MRDHLPFNAEPPGSMLADAEITALDAFYSRNHGPFPDIARGKWRLTVGGMVANPLTLTYDELTTFFTADSVVATLACAGNRRAELLNVRPIPGRTPGPTERSRRPNGVERGWQRFSRPPVCTRMTGPHAFSAPDVAPEAVPVQSYGSSIPLSKAMSREVLLAWEMNSEPLPRVHGGPVGVVVPGYIGARSVKWVNAITVQPGPSDNYFQASDYRILPPEADPAAAAPGDGISLSSLPLNCDILVPGDDELVPAGPLRLAPFVGPTERHPLQVILPSDCPCATTHSMAQGRSRQQT